MSFLDRSEGASEQHIANAFCYDNKTIFYTMTLKGLNNLLQLIIKKLLEQFKHKKFVIFVINTQSPVAQAMLLYGNCCNGVVKKIFGITPSCNMPSFVESIVKNNKILFLDLPKDDDFFYKNIKWLKMLYGKDEDFSAQYKYKNKNKETIIVNYLNLISSADKIVIKEIMDKFKVLRRQELLKIQNQYLNVKRKSCCRIL